MGVLFINNTEIDTSEDVVFPITYAISDIKEPNKRVRSRTKTLTLTDTNRNRLFFSSAYQISLTDVDSLGLAFEFDHRLKYPAVYQSKGVDIFRGVCNLLSVRVNNGVLSIEINLFSDTINIFDSWKDVKISELGWSEYDHVLSKQNIRDSWSNLGATGYVYGLIYFGFGSSPTNYKTNDLIPYIFQNEILIKALNLVGLQLQSSRLNSLDFKNRLWGYGGGEKVSITAQQVAQRYVFVDSDFDIDFVKHFFIPSVSEFQGIRTTKFNGQINRDVDANVLNLTTINNNTLSQLDVVNLDWIGSVTVSETGNYRLTWSGGINVSASWSYGNPSALGYNASMSFYWQFFIYVNGIVVATQTISSTSSQSNVNFNDSLDLKSDTILSSGDVVSYGFTQKVVNATIDTDNVPLIDLFTSKMEMSFFPLTVFDFKMQSIDKELQDGDVVNIARFLPDTTVLDFFNDLIITENLYISEPKDGIIKIDTFDEFYSGDTDEWTSKLDNSKEIIFEPPRLEGKVYKWQFAQDRDYFKNEYFNEFGHDYGDYSITINGSYKKGDKKWITSFAQSVPVDVSPIQNNPLIIPVIAKSEDNGTTFKPHKGKPRVFYWNGLQSCYPWTFRDSLGGSVSSENEYPQFHHLNDINSPTFDLNFGKPNKLYYTASAYTLSNFIQENYFTFIRSILSKSAKIMKAYFNLDESDLYNGFLNSYAMIDCVRFIKNEVLDFDDNSQSTTMVELFKVVDSRKPNVSPDTDTPSPNNPSESIGQSFNDGVGVNNNGGATQSITANTETLLLNDSDSEELQFMPNGVSPIYDGESESFNFDQFLNGSVFDFTAFLEVTAPSNTELNAFFVSGFNTENEISIPLTINDNLINGTFIIDSSMKNKDWQLIFSASNNSTLKVLKYQYLIKSISTWKR